MSVRYWKKGPEAQQNRLSSDQFSVTFTLSGTRNDGVRCFVQETHKFHIEGFDGATLVAEGKLIAEKMRARFDTYLDPMCMCKPNQTVRCPINHERQED